MAEITLFLLFPLLLSTVFSAEAQQRQLNISLGSSLSPTSNSSWLSSSGLFAFGFYSRNNGYAVGVFIAGIPQKTVVWTANRDNPPLPGNTTLLFSGDGGLLLQYAQGGKTSLLTLTQPPSSASMLNSGNFVIYNSDSEIIWQSFSNPTNTLLAGQFLATDYELFSSVSDSDDSTGMFQLAMQGDGNLVQYPMERTIASAYFSTGTFRSGSNVTLHLDDDASLYLLNGTGSNIYNISNGGHPRTNQIYLLRIDPEGIFRIYSYNLTRNGTQSVIYSSSDDLCVAKGLCGLNRFCVVSSQNEPNCVCLPGFTPIKIGNLSSGCERDFTAETCKSRTRSNDYSMQLEQNIVWEDNSYFSLTSVRMEDCRRACLEDCNCEAAIFKDQDCKMQKLPLKFGRRSMDELNSVLIKVGNSISSPVIPLPTSLKTVQNDILTVCIVLACFGLLLIIMFGIVIYKTRYARTYRRIPRNGEAGLSENMSPKSFTYLELEKITNGFKNEIGKGAFGTVYKGTTLDGSKDVAVKRLNELSGQGEREFRTEIRIIGKTHHRNLVQLLGYCLEESHRLLVYQYMSNGSLADILFIAENKPSWEERMEVSRNIARGILYLHEECETQIIHCDIKPQNILIDENRLAKISDFGLAKLVKHDQTKTYTGIRGTRGYVAPEWHRKLPITAKADVFSYGIVLLELIAKRPNLDWNLPEGEAVLEEWAVDCFEAGEAEKLVGDEKVERRKVERVVKLALWCIQDQPSLRPTMKKVLLMLEGTVEIPSPPSPTSFLSAL